MSRWIVDASLSLGWYLKDEEDRSYSLEVLAGLADNEAVVPLLWPYEVSNGLVMANRRKRISLEEFREIITSLQALPIEIDPAGPGIVWDLWPLALKYQLTVYDSAYLVTMERPILRSSAGYAAKS